jgi:hypothetical protein
MEEEDITGVPNRIGGQNLKDIENYVYKRTKTLPLKDKNCWNCMSRQRFDSSVALFTLLHHLDTETAEGTIIEGRKGSDNVPFYLRSFSTFWQVSKHMCEYLTCSVLHNSPSCNSRANPCLASGVYLDQP